LKKQSKRSKVNPVIVEKKNIAYELFEGRCYICRKKYGKGFGYHHNDYLDGELKFNDFNDTIWYHAYLLPLVLEDPERFWLLCKPCHFQMYLADLEDERFDRLAEVVRSTKPRERVKKLNC